MPRPRRQTTDEVTEPTPAESSPEPLKPAEPQPAPEPEDEPTPPEPEDEVQEPEKAAQPWKPGDYVRLQYGKGQIVGFTVREDDPQKDPETYLKKAGWHVISVGKRQM